MSFNFVHDCVRASSDRECLAGMADVLQSVCDPNRRAGAVEKLVDVIGGQISPEQLEEFEVFMMLIDEANGSREGITEVMEVIDGEDRDFADRIRAVATLRILGLSSGKLDKESKAPISDVVGLIKDQLKVLAPNEKKAPKRWTKDFRGRRIRIVSNTQKELGNCLHILRRQGEKIIPEDARKVFEAILEESNANTYLLSWAIQALCEMSRFIDIYNQFGSLIDRIVDAFMDMAEEASFKDLEVALTGIRIARNYGNLVKYLEDLKKEKRRS